MADSLKVLMMGGPRSGKTSALAGLVDSMINGDVSKLIQVRDITESGVVRQKLAQKIENLKLTLRQSCGKTIIVDDSKTDAYQHYTIEFAIPSTDNKMNVIFTDANGEFFESGREHDSEICRMVRDSDVFVIAIDTPSLMEAANPENHLMTEAVNKAINNVNDIHNFITYLDDKDGADAKLVIFVPLKCEKWAHEGRLDAVSERVKNVYSVPIQALYGFKNVEMDIVPIQTVGGIVFTEHLKSYLCLSENSTPLRCSKIDGNTRLRFADGEERKIIATKDKIKVDPQSVIKEGSTILRPNSWFKVVEKTYSPKNCEQLAFYLLRFVLSKYLFVKEIEQRSKKKKLNLRWMLRDVGEALHEIVKDPFDSYSYSNLSYVVSFHIRKAIEYMGTINYDQLHNLINTLNEQKLIKSSGEGICCLKKSLLRYD